MSNLKMTIMKVITAITAVLAFALMQTVHASSIDNGPADSGQDVGFFGSLIPGFGQTYLGQSFVSPVTASGQDFSLTFQLSDMTPGNAIDVMFSVLLTETTGIGNDLLPTSAFANSDVFALTGSACAGGSGCTVTFQNISLTAGTTYAWILQAAIGSDYASVGTHAGYANGHYFSAQAYGGAWADTLDGDLAFNITMTAPTAVPVPATLPLLLSGLAGFGLFGRRRT